MRSSESELHSCLRLSRGVKRPRDGFFLCAESLFNVATQIEMLEREDPGLLKSYGGKSLHDQSHGESFLALANHRFGEEGLYILDEPEADLSPGRQLSFLKLIDDHVMRLRSQFIIATHLPIIMAYPRAAIYQLSEKGLRQIPYEETEHYLITRDFLTSRETFFKHLFEAPGESP